MAKKKNLKTYNVQITVTNGIYDLPVRAETLEEALQKGKTELEKKCTSALAIDNPELSCMDEIAAVTGVYEIAP